MKLVKSGVSKPQIREQATKSKARDFCYQMVIKGDVEPGPCDVFALTKRRPRDIGDLSSPGSCIAFVYVLKSDPLLVQSSKVLVEITELLSKKGNTVFATYMMNLTTSLRIWNALNPDPRSKNMGLIQQVLQYDSSEDNDCSLCVTEENGCTRPSTVPDLVASFKLDESQKDAVLRSVSMARCSHRKNKVKLIWGPPGTGKTTTIASMLFVLLKLKCRTVTCAPTNIAVLQVAERLVKIFLGSKEYDTYGLGDIVLFGNSERMMIDNHAKLLDVFLHNRVDALRDCLSPLGWMHNLDTMISLLKDPQQRYIVYLAQSKMNDSCKKGSEASDDKGTNNAMKSKRKNKVHLMASKREKKKRQEPKMEVEVMNSEDVKADCMTLEEFVIQNFYFAADRLVFYAKSFCTHLPTSALPLRVAKQMISLVEILTKITANAREQPLQFSSLMAKKESILLLVETLLKKFPKPVIKGGLQKFCLEKAVLVFCTVSGSVKVRAGADLVIIDEAAQLKECESTIPLQIPHIKNAILIGDDRQLPAMVQSKNLVEMNFGRSMFQRLATLGKKRHLLNIQYRMHPSISSFPNHKFYENSILDAPRVKEINYTRKFLEGDMYGSFTFINVSSGREDFSEGHSPRNVEEATVIHSIIGMLFNYHRKSKQAISVGVISPYKGQVALIQDNLGNKYVNQKKRNGSVSFAVSVRSVDGFQGGEEDIIIISTVRSNNRGSVGFLSCHQRTNVAVTRARYCLWIVGNGSTLVNSRSVWQDLVIDAKRRGCFFDADQDTVLQQASLMDVMSLDLPRTRWKVVFSDDFRKSLANITCKETSKQVKKFLNKIANGWRPSGPKNAKMLSDHGASCELLEVYKVTKKKYCVWSTDIQKDGPNYTQVLKIWDIIPPSEISKRATKLDILYGRYTVDMINCCKKTSFEGNMVVPMSWPIQSVSDVPVPDDHTECLSSQLSAMNLRDSQPYSSSFFW